ncbi:hypothetical protein FNU79_18005 [Deinococcus detaillensis]|uniref:HAD family hydrolase n=1 Tax=Deinococcus detaillensis TaxID=2592048 RepID=A0A553UGR7_9DEIO|nr:hypothetical protein [Deinococcus detaillensis]TSA79402.1 hypothetical protein FNU79_18005 [Deinococcus detaillensis]
MSGFPLQTEVPESNAQKVQAFHVAIDSPYPKRPIVPNAERLSLRLTLLREEMQEVEAEFQHLSANLAATPADLAPLAHELADLLYVTYGALGALGVDADAVFAEVHRANLSKTSGPRRADGKQLKPGGWQKADVLRVMLAEMKSGSPVER